MAKAVIMPALGMAQDTGLIISWLKNEGDTIAVGDILMEVETDKATAEIESEYAGVLTNITAFAGDDVPVAETIAWLLAPGEALPPEAESQWRSPSLSDAVAESMSSAAPIASAAPTAVQAKGSATVSATPVAARMAQEHDLDLADVKPDGGKVSKKDIELYLQMQAHSAKHYRLTPASPLARQLAKDKMVDVTDIRGSGPDGAVLAADVKAYQPQPRSELATVTPEPVVAPAAAASTLSPAWRTMATRLSQAWQSIPHFYLKREVDCTALKGWLKVAKKQTDGTATFTDLLIKATSVALRHHPQVNASWLNDTIVFNEEINMGVAVAVDDGLLVPVIHRSDRLSMVEIADARKGVVTRALAGKPKLQDLQGGTFSISNLGMFGIDEFSAIVNPPNAGILAVGKMADRVVPINGEMVIRPILVLTASFDHRVVDGARGARFLDTLAQFLEEPLSII